MYLDTWDDFQKAAENIYETSPERPNGNLQTRYLSSYRHIDGELILKVTDDISAPWTLSPSDALQICVDLYSAIDVDSIIPVLVIITLEYVEGREEAITIRNLRSDGYRSQNEYQILSEIRTLRRILFTFIPLNLHAARKFNHTDQR
ncbi:hypothetical protein NQZ79_g5977 [Umbelopsis isabellina]|nr:hypothetical protein NQZ79_g5977 [Umbelopsis isabellina]